MDTLTHKTYKTKQQDQLRVNEIDFIDLSMMKIFLHLTEKQQDSKGNSNNAKVSVHVKLLRDYGRNLFQYLELFKKNLSRWRIYLMCFGKVRSEVVAYVLMRYHHI